MVKVFPRQQARIPPHRMADLLQRTGQLRNPVLIASAITDENVGHVARCRPSVYHG